MTRAARITVENGRYYVITRSTGKQTVFAEPADYEKYIYLLVKYKKRYKFKLYCFCIMTDTVYFIIQVKEPAKLQKIMQSLNTTYAQYFNVKYARVGYVWHDRFKSRLIDGDSYLLECIKYIESNPVRAGLTREPQKYSWSSAIFRLNNNGIIDSLFAID